MKKFLMFLFCALSSFVASAQCDSTKFLIGLNLPPLEAGAPELQLAWFPTRYIGLTTHAGFATRFPGYFDKVERRFSVNSFSGNWYKAGITAQYNVCKNPRAGLLYINLLYVQSWAEEKGTYTDTSLTVHNTMSANGFALGFGAYFRILHLPLYICMGGQLGFATKQVNYHENRELLTNYMPGFSSMLVEGMQGQIGICYRFGHRWTKEEREIVK